MKDEGLPLGDGLLPICVRLALAAPVPWLGASTPLHTSQRVPGLGHQLSPSLVGTPRQEQDAGVQGGSTRCPLPRAMLG